MACQPLCCGKEKVGLLNNQPRKQYFGRKWNWRIITFSLGPFFADILCNGWNIALILNWWLVAFQEVQFEILHHFIILKIERRKRSSIQKSWEPRGEREMIFQNLENREENETWNFTSPAREGKPRIISLREFLEIETLVKDCNAMPYFKSLCRDHRPK